MDIKEKIKKLLALATSPNENEAKAAMLKARSLMMQNKLTEADFVDEKAELVHLTTEISWTTDSGNIWEVELANLIAEKHCSCVSWSTRGRTHTAIVTGMGQDAYVCRDILGYAIGFVLNKIRVLQRKAPDFQKRAIAKSYASGFCLGMQIAYEQQQEEHPEWGLVVVKPDEVVRHQEKLTSRSVKTPSASFDPLAYLRGQEDGMEWGSRKALTETR